MIEFFEFDIAVAYVWFLTWAQFVAVKRRLDCLEEDAK
jgi:hypothetical protein